MLMAKSPGVRRWSLPVWSKAIEDLHFVPATKVNSRVAPLGDHELHVQVEVGEVLLRQDVRAPRGVDVDTVVNRPAVAPPLVFQRPPAEVVAVEQ